MHQLVQCVGVGIVRSSVSSAIILRRRNFRRRNEILLTLNCRRQIVDRQFKIIDSYLRGQLCFQLYDTYGFPLDLTELMARERGLTVDKDGFEKLMEEQRARARAAQKKEVISLSQIETTAPTKFIGFEKLEAPARVLEVVSVKDKTAVVLDTSPFYAEMGGQVGDTGEITGGGNLWRIVKHAEIRKHLAAFH